MECFLKLTPYLLLLQLFRIRMGYFVSSNLFTARQSCLNLNQNDYIPRNRIASKIFSEVEEVEVYEYNLEVFLNYSSGEGGGKSTFSTMT